jgi:hypothetical protein
MAQMWHKSETDGTNMAQVKSGKKGRGRKNSIDLAF